MAMIIQNLDGSLVVTLTPTEQDTVAALPADQLAQYVTLWLQERGKSVLQEWFDKLSEQEKTDVMVTLRKADAVKGGGMEVAG